MRIATVVAPIVTVLSLAGAYFALPDSWRNAFISDVQAGDRALEERIILVDRRMDNEEVCRLRSESRRLQIDIAHASGAYRVWLQEQIDANIRRLKELAGRGAKCAG